MRGQLSIFDGTQYSLENQSIKLIKSFEDAALQRNPLGYVVGYSGGKDSDVLVHLFRRAGVKFCVVHNHTTLDLPETVYYIRRKFYEWELQGMPCKIYPPKTNFWSLCLAKKMLPSRKFRFCCAEFKERNDIPELKYALRCFGVRKAESAKRNSQRDSIETRNREDYSDFQKFHFDDAEEVKQTGACYTNNYLFINPLAYWSTDYVWDYVEGERLEVNPKYAEGYNRIGCALCPKAKYCQRLRESKEYPQFTNRFIRLADDIIQVRKAQNMPNKYNFKTGAEYFDMWLNNNEPTNKDDYNLLDFSEDDYE